MKNRKRFFCLLTLALLSLALLAGCGSDGGSDESRFSVHGRWHYGFAGQYDCIDIDGQGNWKFYSTDPDSHERYVADEGYLSYSPKDDVAYLYSSVGGELDGSYIEDVGPDWILIPDLSYYIYNVY